MSAKCPKRSNIILARYYLKLSALVRYYIKPIQTNPNSQCWGDNKPVLNIPLVLTISRLTLTLTFLTLTS